MLFTTATQFVVLALLFIAGWLFGLASHPGGRRWKERYATEREAHATSRRDQDARVADADRRNAELERDNARLASAAPVTAATVAPRPIVTPRAVPAARPAYPDGERRGWFDWSKR